MSNPSAAPGGITQLGTAVKFGVSSAVVTIAGVAIRTAQTISEGYMTTTETAGETSGNTENVILANWGIEISVTGYIDASATAYPKNGDSCTITSGTTGTNYAIAWIDNVSIAETNSDKAVFSCTAHGRHQPAQGNG